MTFPILASLLVRLVVLLPFQLLRLSPATPSRWSPLALSVFLHCVVALLFFFSSRRLHTRWTGDWSSDVCSSDLPGAKWTTRKTSGCRGRATCWYMCRQREWSSARSEERRVGKECRSRWAT